MKKLIVGNWKMNPVSLKEARKIGAKLAEKIIPNSKVEAVVCPPFVYLMELAQLVKGKKFSLGAQNASAGLYGAETGEISSFMLRDLKVKYLIVGHSERRARGETDVIVNEKLKVALREGFRVILCIGEPEYDETGEYLNVLHKQLNAALSGVPKKQLENLVVAHEPVWAIGEQAKGADTPERFQHNRIFIRRVLSELVPKNAMANIPVLYGGSVTIRNAEMFLRVGEADGLLIGRESLNPDNFAEIVALAGKK